MLGKRPDRDARDDLTDSDETDDLEEFEVEDTLVMPSDVADDDDDDEADEIDVTGEMNVEKLMAEMEKTSHDDVARRKEIRRRLEEIQERRSLEDTYSFDLYEDD